MTAPQDDLGTIGRVTELETRLEFQDELIARLNDELVVHQQRIVALEKNLDLLIQRWQQGPEELPDADPRNEPPPPHY